MGRISDASFLIFVPTERLATTWEARHPRLIRHNTPSTAGDSARPSNRAGPLTESRRQTSLILDLERPVSAFIVLPHKICDSGKRKGVRAKSSPEVAPRGRRHTECEGGPLLTSSSLVAAAHVSGREGFKAASACLPPGGDRVLVPLLLHLQMNDAFHAWQGRNLWEVTQGGYPEGGYPARGHPVDQVIGR